MFFKSGKPTFDYLVAGLGNPGLQYENTRHNAGFMAIDKLALGCGCEFNKNKFEALCGDAEIGQSRVLLLKPQTYMNNSGRAVAAACSFYKIPVNRVIIMFDDISLCVGTVRLRRKGSAGGHNGVKDIIELLGTDEIMRIKIGVGQKPDKNSDLVSWVLGKIPDNDFPAFDTSLSHAAQAATKIITDGIDRAMNAYSK